MSGRVWLVWVSLMEVADIVGGICQIVSGLQGAMLRSALIAGPFHQVF